MLPTKSLQLILEEQTQEIPSVIDGGILLEKTLLLIYGTPKVGKTFFGLNLALSIANGKPFVGFGVPNPRKVLYLLGEGGEAPMAKRIRKMCEGIEDTQRENLYIAFDTRFNILDEACFTNLSETVHNKECKVVVLDPLISYHVEDENAIERMARVMDKFRQLTSEREVSIILIHHCGKDLTKGPRGASSISGAYDSGISISRKDSLFTLRFDLRHEENPEPRKIIFDKQSFWFKMSETQASEAGNTTADPGRNPILSTLAAHGGEMSRRDLVRSLVEEGRYANDRSAYNAIRRAFREELLELNEHDFVVRRMSMPNN